jgi:hypothetical protein
VLVKLLAARLALAVEGFQPVEARALLAEALQPPVLLHLRQQALAG